MAKVVANSVSDEGYLPGFRNRLGLDYNTILSDQDHNVIASFNFNYFVKDPHLQI